MLIEGRGRLLVILSVEHVRLPNILSVGMVGHLLHQRLQPVFFNAQSVLGTYLSETYLELPRNKHIKSTLFETVPFHPSFHCCSCAFQYSRRAR